MDFKPRKLGRISAPYVLLIGGVLFLGVLAINRQVPGGLGTTERVISTDSNRTPDGRYYLGRLEAPITVTEYTDFQCPYCRKFVYEIRETVMRHASEGNVRFVLADFPLRSHRNAFPAAIAARCAGKAGRFWEYHDALFYHQDNWARRNDPDSVFLKLARDNQVPMSDFESCLRSDDQGDFVQTSLASAEKLGVEATPTFTVESKNYKSGLLYIDDLADGIESAVRAMKTNTID